MMRYPVTITPDDGAFVVTFPDVPGAITYGDTIEEAIARAPDALLTIFDAYMKDRRDIPAPSPVYTGVAVELPTLESAKVELYRWMRAMNVNKTELARRLDWHMPQVDRVLDVHHGSQLDQLDAAFTAIGKHLRISIEDATPPAAVSAGGLKKSHSRRGHAGHAGVFAAGGAKGAYGSRAGARGFRTKNAAKKR
jgi:antitoxin HicB